MEFTRYKALRASKLVILVPPAYSSQECAFCTFTSPESPRVFCVDNRPHQAAFVCQQCGHTDHAGHNAACVIAKRGIQKLLSGDPLTKMHKPTRIFPHKNREDFRKLDRMMTPSRAPESVVGTLRVSGKYFREDWCLMEQYTKRRRAPNVDRKLG